MVEHDSQQGSQPPSSTSSMLFKKLQQGEESGGQQSIDQFDRLPGLKRHLAKLFGSLKNLAVRLKATLTQTNSKQALPHLGMGSRSSDNDSE